MRRGLVGFILFLVGGLFLSVGTFAAPLPIDNSPQFRDTVQGPDGSLHTVWVAQNDRHSSLLYQVKDAADRTLTGPIVIADTASRIRRPQLAIAQSAINGRQVVHLLWQERLVDPAGQVTAIRYATLTLAPAGATPLLSQPVTINQDRTATHPSLAVDQTGWAYAAWEIEGQDVVLAAIDPAGRIGQIRHITREATKTDHALPTVAVDRRGNVHVVWSAQSGDKTQLVYKAFRGHGGQVLEKEKIVYTVNGDLNQTKVLTFNPQGAIKVSWVNTPGRHAGQYNRPARSGPQIGKGYLLLRHGHSDAVSVVAAVVDESFTAMPGPVWSMAGEAMISPKPRLDAPAMDRVSLHLNAIPIGTPLSAGGDESVSKLLMERLLRYATWSAAPPSIRGTSATCLLLSKSSAHSARSRFIAVALSSLFSSDSKQPGVSDSLDLSAFQPVPFTQGGALSA